LILFEYKKPEILPPAMNPGPVFFNDNGVRKYVIDVINNHPLRDFTDLPFTISTKVEGYLQEAWFRMNPGLEPEDLIQRMPYTVADGVYNNRRVINRLVRRRGLFRDEGKCLSWNKSSHKKIWDLRLIEEMTQNPDPTAPNSTRHLMDRDADEKQEIKDDTYATGKHLARGRGRELQGRDRQEKDRAVAERRANRRSVAANTAVDDEKDEGIVFADQTESQITTTDPTQTPVPNNTTTIQQQPHLALSPADSDLDPTPYEDIHTAGHAAMRTGDEIQQDGLEVPGGYHGLLNSEAPQHLMTYAVGSQMNKIASHAHPMFFPADRQQNILSPDERSMNPRNHHQELQQSDGRFNNFGPVSGQSHQAGVSPGGPQRTSSRRPRSASAMGRVNNLIGLESSSIDPQLRQIDNRIHVRSHSDPEDTYPSQRQVGNDVKYRSAPVDHYQSQAQNSRNIIPNGATQNDLHQQRSTTMRASPFLVTPQGNGNTYTDQDDHVWTGPDVSAAMNDGSAYDAATYSTPAQSAPNRRRAAMVDGNHQRWADILAKAGVSTGTSRNSSRKRGAGEELDDDYVNFSKKLRKSY
jgi:hypothetical protein